MQSGESKPMKEPSFFPFATPNNGIEDVRGKEKKDQPGGFFPFATPNPSQLRSFLNENRGMKNHREQLGEEDDERNDDTFGDYDDENEEEARVRYKSIRISCCMLFTETSYLAIWSTID